jgi:hypothetical protein
MAVQRNTVTCSAASFKCWRSTPARQLCHIHVLIKVHQHNHRQFVPASVEANTEMSSIYKNTQHKLLKTNAAIWFNKMWRKTSTGRTNQANTEMFDVQYHSALFWLKVHNVRSYNFPLLIILWDILSMFRLSWFIIWSPVFLDLSNTIKWVI